MVRSLGLLAAVAALGLGSVAIGRPALAATTSPVRYRVTKIVHLGPPDRWDYVVYAPSSDRVFVAHGNEVTVVDGQSGRIVGHVGPLPGGSHGIAFDQAAGVGITDDGGRGQAVIFGLHTLKVVARVKVQRGADAVTFDPVSGHAFVVDGATGTVAVIDPQHRRVVRFIHLGGDLEYAVPGDNGQLYVNGVTHHEIFRINTATNRVDAVWPMPKCRDPHGLSIDLKTHRLFSSCGNARMVVMNADTGAVVSVLPIGRGTDADRFDPVDKLAFSSNGRDGTLSVIREVNANTFVPVTTVKTAVTARTMGLDPATGRIYLVAAKINQKAMPAFLKAIREHKRPHVFPFVHGSVELLFLDRVK